MDPSQDVIDYENTEEFTTVAGHPSAMKVSGVRKSRPTPNSKQVARTSTSNDDDLGLEEEKKDKNQKTLVSGAIVTEKDHYTPSSVKSYQNKPKPSIEKHTKGKPFPTIINQPK
ncbi:hypothetical protein SNEBB_002376 [Seison nebaliae]|nr:hypothetical protein SNEBB_002376 [Seison nebaliae]